RHQERLSGKTGLPQTYDFRIISKNGKIIWVQLSTVVIQMKGRPATLNFLHDITERKRAEEALKEKMQLLQNITDNMFDLVSLTDMKGNFTFLGASHKILKYDLEHLIGKNVLEVIHPEDLPEISSVFNDFLFSVDDKKS
uniref:PAS domain-containing protein n=1 Tax=Candidatus Electrothrix sp. TaxID=2170559 RepID=UPI004056CFE8